MTISQIISDISYQIRIKKQKGKKHFYKEDHL